MQPLVCQRILAIAECDPVRGIRLAQRAWAAVRNDPTESAWAALTFGQVLILGERLAEARPLIEQALVQFSALELEPAVHDGQFALLRLSRLGGRGAELLPEWERLAEQYQQAGNPLSAMRVQFEQIAQLNLLGHTSEALAQITALESAVKQHGVQADLARLHRLRAVALTDYGELDAALHEHQAALTIYQTLRRPVDVAQTLVNRAWVQQRREDFDAALADLEQAAPIFDRYQLKLLAAFCRRNLGVVASRVGRFAQALADILRARQQFIQLDRLIGVAACDLNLGIVVYYLGLFDLAQALYLQAQHQFEQLGSQRELLVVRRNRALALRAAGQPAAALRLLGELQGEAERIDRLEHAEIVAAQGQTLRDLGQTDAAQACLVRAEGLFQGLNNRAAAAECRLELSWLALANGDSAQARADFSIAGAGLAGRPIHHWRVAYGLGRCASLLGDDGLAQAHYREASRIIWHLRRRIASEHASSGLFAQAQQLYSDALQTAARQNDALAVIELDRQQRALAFERQLLITALQPHATQPSFQAHVPSKHATSADLDLIVQNNVAALLLGQNAFGEVPEIEFADNFDLDELRRQLNAAFSHDWTALTYCILADQLLIVVLNQHAVELVRVPLHSTLRTLIEQACHAEQRYATYQDFAFLQGSTKERWSVLRELGQALLPPQVISRFHPDHRLLIVPSGVLHGLSWAALRVAERWLCELATIQVLPGLAHWSWLQQRTNVSTKALAIGCESFADRAPPLPSALATIDLLAAAWYGTTERMVNPRRAELLTRAASGEFTQYRLIQIASHGHLLAGRGLLAHLKLADADLLYIDIRRLAVHGALVVLAACDGGASEVLPGEEVLSLSWAWLIAGARDVVASLWTLYDQTVLSVLGAFYAELGTDRDPPTALVLAQRALIAQSRNAEAEIEQLVGLPFVWGSLVALGAGARPLAGGTPCERTA